MWETGVKESLFFIWDLCIRLEFSCFLLLFFFFLICMDIMGTLLFLPHHFLYQTHSKINRNVISDMSRELCSSPPPGRKVRELKLSNPLTLLTLGFTKELTGGPFLALAAT